MTADAVEVCSVPSLVTLNLYVVGPFVRKSRWTIESVKLAMVARGFAIGKLRKIFYRLIMYICPATWPGICHLALIFHCAFLSTSARPSNSQMSFPLMYVLLELALPHFLPVTFLSTINPARAKTVVPGVHF